MKNVHDEWANKEEAENIITMLTAWLCGTAEVGKRSVAVTPILLQKWMVLSLQFY